MGKAYSLHLGLNQVDPKSYSGWDGKLSGCIRDADAMEEIAKARGFTTTKLTDAAATRASVSAKLGELAKTLTKGDLLLMSYSGHGGSIPDVNGDEDDGLDETWCLFDGQILDDEINKLYAGFADGVRIIVISDSCHSGTVTKGPGVEENPLSRAMPLDVVVRVYNDNRGFYDGLQDDIPRDVVKDVRASVLLLSGCQDDQTSLDGPFNGAFTTQLLKVWDKGKFAGNFQSFHLAIAKAMPKSQTPNLFEIGIGTQIQLPPFSL